MAIDLTIILNISFITYVSTYNTALIFIFKIVHEGFRPRVVVAKMILFCWFLAIFCVGVVVTVIHPAFITHPLTMLSGADGRVLGTVPQR